MTVCIAGICAGGSQLVLATDAMLTNPWIPIQFEQPAKKMTRLSESCLALTAGDALAHTELFSMVEAEMTRLRAPSVLDVVRKVKECYQAIRNREIIERILMPRGFGDFGDFYKAHRVLLPEIAMPIQMEIDAYDYGLEILIGAVDRNKAHIYGIFNPGTSKCFDAVGFHAIGSGLPHAINTLIARGWHHAIPLEEGLMMVYEAKKVAEKAPGVGASVTDMAIVSTAGVQELPLDVLQKLQKIYEKRAEKEAASRADLAALYTHEEQSGEQFPREETEPTRAQGNAEQEEVPNENSGI